MARTYGNRYIRALTQSRKATPRLVKVCPPYLRSKRR